MKGFRSTQIFAFVVILFGAYVYYFEYLKKNEDEKMAEEAKRIVQVAEEAIDEIGLVVAGDEIFRLKKDKIWNLVSPVADLADKNASESYAKTLSKAKAEFVVGGDEFNAKEFGLDTPKGEILVKAGEKNWRIRFGSVETYEGEAYIQINDEKKVFLAKPSLASLLDKSVDDYRDRRLFREPSETVELKLDDKLHLVKKDKEWWLADSQDPLHQAKARTYINSLKIMRSTRFASENKDPVLIKRYGLHKPEHTLWMKEKDREYTVEFGPEKDGHVYFIASHRDQIFQIYPNNRDAVLKEPSELKEEKKPEEKEQKEEKK